jgi:septum site-determining protein MinD
MGKSTNNSQVFVVTSGKGGVGKTTTVANISTGWPNLAIKL